jgi:hypothetical protein
VTSIASSPTAIFAATSTAETGGGCWAGRARDGRRLRRWACRVTRHGPMRVLPWRMRLLYFDEAVWHLVKTSVVDGDLPSSFSENADFCGIAGNLNLHLEWADECKDCGVLARLRNACNARVCACGQGLDLTGLDLTDLTEHPAWFSSAHRHRTHFCLCIICRASCSRCALGVLGWHENHEPAIALAQSAQTQADTRTPTRPKLGFRAMRMGRGER